MSNPSGSEDGRTENPDFSILTAEDKPAKPFTVLFGAALPVENRDMPASADSAKIVEVFRQISGKLAVGELMANRNFIHGKRHGTGEILDEVSVLTLVRIPDEVAPQRFGDSPYFLVVFFKDVQARFSGAVKGRICGGHRKRHVGLLCIQADVQRDRLPRRNRYSSAPTR